ncbi:hypothetical protein ACFP3Q_02455 [Nocardioides sp. GCM10027113]|uniref:hypothetical protein n=1 Tax=unclassified Nocardioides TaxID=2615069 RepID=UPI00360D50E5
MHLRPTPLRRTLALSTTALVLSTLGACGFDEATNRVYTPGAGVNNRDASVDVLSAVIVSAEDGSGTFIATFVNNEELEAATVEEMAGAGETTLDFTGFSPFEVPAAGAVNLNDEGGVEVEGDFDKGDFIPVSIRFGDGEQIEMDVVVVDNCGDYEGIDGESECIDPDEVHGEGDH